MIKFENQSNGGTYGKDGDQPLSYVKLSDMSTDHIIAVLDNVDNVRPAFKRAMRLELELREIKEEYEQS